MLLILFALVFVIFSIEAFTPSSELHSKAKNPSSSGQSGAVSGSAANANKNGGGGKHDEDEDEDDQDKDEDENDQDEDQDDQDEDQDDQDEDQDDQDEEQDDQDEEQDDQDEEQDDQDEEQDDQDEEQDDQDEDQDEDEDQDQDGEDNDDEEDDEDQEICQSSTHTNGSSIQVCIDVDNTVRVDYRPPTDTEGVAPASVVVTSSTTLESEDCKKQKDGTWSCKQPGSGKGQDNDKRKAGNKGGKPNKQKLKPTTWSLEAEDEVQSFKVTATVNNGLQVTVSV